MSSTPDSLLLETDCVKKSCLCVKRASRIAVPLAQRVAAPYEIRNRKKKSCNKPPTARAGPGHGRPILDKGVGDRSLNCFGSRMGILGSSFPSAIFFFSAPAAVVKEDSARVFGFCALKISIMQESSNQRTYWATDVCAIRPPENTAKLSKRRPA